MTLPDDPKLEIVTARLPEGTTTRIDRMLKGGELRSAFIRIAVEAELQKREKAAKRQRAAARARAEAAEPALA